MADASVNNLQLRWIVSEVNPDYRWVEISIDGRNLIDLVMEWENSLDFPDRSRKEYNGVPEYLFAEREYYADAWFGFQPGSDADDVHGSGIYGQKVSLLECGYIHCGVVDCWPLICNITFESEFAIWDGFDNPRRVDRILDFSEGNVEPSTGFYTGFGPFVFRQSNYIEELNALLENTEYVGPVD